jgi:putative membrane protein
MKSSIQEVLRMPHYYPMMDDYYFGWNPFMSLGMGLVWLIFLIVVAYFVYKLIKSEKILAPKKPLIQSATDIVDERYAKGELTREQYMQMKEDLKKIQ